MPFIYPGQLDNSKCTLLKLKPAITSGSGIKPKTAFSTIYQGHGSWRDIGNTRISLGGKQQFSAAIKQQEMESRKIVDEAITDIIKNAAKQPRTKEDIMLGGGFKYV